MAGIRKDASRIRVRRFGLDHHLDHRVGWVERSETQHFVFVGFRSSTQPTFHALAEIMIKADDSLNLPLGLLKNIRN
jgi:hypothetical protein